jgi:hypothetical protein
MNRRHFLTTVGGGAAALALLRREARAAAASTASNHAADDALLDDLARRSFQYFWEQSDPHTGIVRGRAHTDGSDYVKERRDVGTTGGTGFALTAMCIGAERGWVSRTEARDRVRATLHAYADGPVKNEHGWFYHWLNVKSGARTGAAYDAAQFGVREGSKSNRPFSEVSTSDSTWLIAGALTARQYFHEDEQIRRLATLLYDRVDYRWMCDGKPTLSHGYMPETGLLPAHYDKYCQLACMNLLGIASSNAEHAMPAENWYAWERNANEFHGYRYVGTSVLWTYQWPFCWFDLRGRREARGSRVNYFENSAIATKAHKVFCVDELGPKFPGCYADDLWGITSSESAKGYKAWGGPPARASIDGSVVPCAAIGSLMFTPEICLPVIRTMKERFGEKIYGRYGFADAFHPTNGWVCSDVLAIDIGITLLAIENFRSGNVWRWFMANPETQRALALAQLEPERV